MSQKLLSTLQSSLESIRGYMLRDCKSDAVVRKEVAHIRESSESSRSANGLVLSER